MEGRRLSIPLNRRPLLGRHCFMRARGGIAGGDLHPSRSGPWVEAASDPTMRFRGRLRPAVAVIRYTMQGT